MRTIWLALLSLLLTLAHDAVAQTPATAAAAGAMRRAASALLAATAPDQHKSLVRPFTLEERGDWHYTPRSRTGIALKDMNDAQRGAARELLAAALTAPGLAKIDDVMALEHALRELDTLAFLRVPGNYAFAIFGDPTAAAWGWRIEGHHLSLHFTLTRDAVVTSLPQFIGANPAEVPRAIRNAPPAGHRVLGEEEDLARALLAALGDRRRTAVFSSRLYGDIVTRNAQQLDPVKPAGISAKAFSPAEQQQLMKLIEAFARHLRPELFEARMARVRNGGLDAVHFGWAGSEKRGEPHYFRIQGPHFLIEYDNSGGNHVHSVWRDPEGDWGRDVLGQHYRDAAGSGRSH